MLEISKVSGGVSSPSLNLKRITTTKHGSVTKLSKARKKPHEENSEKDEIKPKKRTKYMHLYLLHVTSHIGSWGERTTPYRRGDTSTHRGPFWGQNREGCHHSNVQCSVQCPIFSVQYWHPKADNTSVSEKTGPLQLDTEVFSTLGCQHWTLHWTLNIAAMASLTVLSPIGPSMYWGVPTLIRRGSFSPTTDVGRYNMSRLGAGDVKLVWGPNATRL